MATAMMATTTTTTTTRLFRQAGSTSRRITATSTCTSATPQSPYTGSWFTARQQSTQAYTTGGTVLHSEWINSNNKDTNSNNDDSNAPNDNNNNNHTLVFLHGLLGNSRNLQTMAKKMCAATNRPGLLVDLTGHGKSRKETNSNSNSNSNNPAAARPVPVPVTFDTCLADIHATLLSQNIAGSDSDNEEEQQQQQVTLVGHSLGGRLALQYAHEQYHDQLQHVWLLDTVPGQPHASVVQVLQIAEAVLLEQNWSGITRKEITAVLHDQYGLDTATAMWLASGFAVHKETGRAAFGFDANVARDLVEDFGRQDFMHELQQTVFRSDSDRVQNEYNDNNHHQNGAARNRNRHPVRIDLVRGAKNTAWEASGHLPALANLVEQYKDQFGFHTVQAGHNVHAEDLPGLMKAVDRVYNKL